MRHLRGQIEVWIFFLEDYFTMICLISSVFLSSYERSMGLPQVRVFSLENQEAHLVPLPETLCTLHPGGNGVRTSYFRVRSAFMGDQQTGKWLLVTS